VLILNMKNWKSFSL